MPRKLRLSVRRKNEFRKKCAAKALAQKRAAKALAQSVPTTLVVSWPLKEVSAPTLLALRQRIRFFLTLPTGWCDSSSGDTNKICFSRVQVVGEDTRILTLEVSEEFSWIIRVHGEVIETSDLLPARLDSVSSISKAMQTLDTCNFCTGNEDERFHQLQASRKGVFTDCTGSTQARFVKDFFPYPTIRSSACQVLLPFPETRCKVCFQYRKSLNSLLSRQRKDKDSADPRSHTNYRYLKTPEKQARMNQLHLKVRSTDRQIHRLKQRLDKAIEYHGIEVDDTLHQDLSTIMTNNSTAVLNEHPEGSFARLFWQQQQKASQLKNARSMRWEPAMIRWCIFLRHLSGSAYQLLQDSGVVKLPSQRTLRDYSYYTESSSGFSASVDLQLMDLAKMESCRSIDKYVIIIMDEMHIRENICYDKHTGAIIGFTDLGDVNNQLLAYEKYLDEGEEKEEVAKSMLVLMVRGLFTKLQFAYAQFPCASVCGHHLYDVFWEAVERLERCGFKVVACTCDGLSANRNFFKLHGEDQDVHKVVNPYSDDGRSIFFLSDPPHLIKTTRNCWASNKRLMWFDGKYIIWDHLKDLYHRCRPSVSSPGLTILPKLKFEHVSLTSFSKMRVDLAAQVLSNSVSKALKLTGGPEVEQTARFVEMFDKLFDCLNVASLDAGKHSRNAFKAPYHSARDFRLKWLKEEFLGYLDQWERSVMARKEFKKTEKNKMMLSKETRDGLRLTVLSFVELVEYIFTIPGVTVFLSNRICQDPLENFFGQQRQRGRVNENPSVGEFIKNTQALRVVNTSCASVRGNCRGKRRKKGDSFEVENTPLKKRKTKH